MSAPKFSADQVEEIVDSSYDDLGVYVRDTELAMELSAKYQPGLILREKGLTYASYRVGGPTANHRFAIFSNHMFQYPDPENYGLVVASENSKFKVIGRHDNDKVHWIILLHLLDDDYWRVFLDLDVPFDSELVKNCVDWLKIKSQNPVIPELSRTEWLTLCQKPLGLDERGQFYPL
ncbi:MAG: hypothetical protein LBT86_05290 [Deltaproteobacteria bacterium]|nr:hypothetical protein [Deltaproteobacteria bacterium]